MVVHLFINHRIIFIRTAAGSVATATGAVHFESGGEAVATGAQAEDSDERGEEGEIDISGWEGEFLHNEQGDQHDDRGKNGSDACEDAEQDRDATDELSQGSGVSEQGWGWEAETCHHTGEHVHSRGAAEQFAVAVHDENGTDTDTEGEQTDITS